MKKVNINLWGQRGEPRLLSLYLRDYEGTQELKELVLVIEDSLKKNFPGIQVNRIRRVRELFQEGRREGQ